MKSFPRISIVTPCYNQAQFIEECILSVINQNYPDIEYIVIDGGSTDGTIEIIKKYSDRIAYWVSEKDRGFCHALQKGFEKTTGDIMAWINADDKYHAGAFQAVAEIFNTFPEIKWLMGHPMLYSWKGIAINHISHEWARWSKFRFFVGDYLAIQQESTFWKRELWEQAGGTIGLDVQIAADFELWCRFFRYEKLYTTNALIGGFRFSSAEQLSLKNKKLYIAECKKIIRREINRMTLLQKAEALLRGALGLPLTPFFRMNIPFLSRLYVFLMKIPDVVYYDFNNQTFVKDWCRR
jgi:glycosyltransferase involved in cell wall biosynthesis